MSIIEDLEERGVLKDKTNGISDFIKNNDINIYCGTDPTADSLHVGHLIPIITLLRLKKSGINNKVTFLIGGATGMIGDPSFKSAERTFLEQDKIKQNTIGIENQVKRLFKDNNCDVNIVNNSDWYSNMNVIDFLREGKLLTVNYMSAKESVKKRIVDGMSFTEFSYQLLQGYDFYHLYEKYGVNIEMGGADQWGNITSGIDFIRKKINKEVHGFTIKLLTKSDGAKFGKTEGGCIWLDKTKTSPYEFYQFWINQSDDDIINLIKIFSLKDLDDINSLIEEHLRCPQKHLLQKTLAEEMLELIHGKDEKDKCVKISEIIFENSDFNEIKNIDGIKDNLKNIENITISKLELKDCKTYYDLLSKTCVANTCEDNSVEKCVDKLFSSKSELKRAIVNNSVSVNKKKITSEDEEFINDDIFSYEFMLVQNGKKNYFVVFFVD